ncbi:transcription initiation factor TFIID subunit 12 isoform X2 [Nicotiana tabacum]|uniref:Transcription initiation factor TFIID subunit 12 isoform X1 n=1 Tax=Nicotiana tabacum TaxID=4097 RepID=A0A1S4DG02_TOBAC|nr:PREDICTED: transcription initiation factor TFIID subunit 12-like isoform X1 [Nicotiana tabacum]
MEQTQPPPTPPPSTSTSQPTEQQQLPPPSPPPPPSSSAAATSQLPSTTTTTTSVVQSQPPQNLNPTTTTTIAAAAAAATSTQQQNPLTPTLQNAQTRQPFNRPWQQPSPFQHFSLPPPPPPPPPHSSSSSSITSSSSSLSMQNPRGGGGMAMGVPAHHPPTSFSSLTPPPPSFGQQFGRNLPDSSAPSSTASQVRQPVQGMHGMGMMGSLGSTSPMRPAGVPQQLRPVASSLRPQTSISSQSAATQNFQGHGMLRVQSVGLPSSQLHTMSQSPKAQNQPWLSSGAQGKPPLPTPSLRPQISPQTLHQRSHILSQHQHTVTTSSSAQQSQLSTSSQSQDHMGQQMPPSRIPQSLSNQPLARGQGLGVQRPSSHALMQSATVKPGPPSKVTTLETEEPCTRILSKRSIQEILAQIDPSEKLDAEVEDVLVDIAEEFVESITTFGCSLAKHRKSNTLEAKDILLHLERNWNMTLPGFSGDEIRTYKKPFTSDIHKERIAAIKKSGLVAEMTNAKGSAQAGGGMKGHLAKGAANILGSPNAKT